MSLVGELMVGVEIAAVAQNGKRRVVENLIHHDDTELQVQDWSTVPEVWLKDAVARMTKQELSLMLRHKIIAYCWLPHNTVHCIVDEGSLREGRRLGLTLVGRISPELYRSVVRRSLAKKLEQRAVRDLGRNNPAASAQKRLSTCQSVAASLLLAVLLVVTVSFSAAAMLTGVQMLASLFFLVVVFLRCLCLMPLPKGRGMVAPLLADAQLPVYTVLVPLFREISVLHNIVHSLQMLNYPPEKLDIKIILEENDRPMHLAVRDLNLPWYFDILIVPVGKPQTKPRALNYAMQFARGTLATIYDGEDIPQPNQLRLAASQFEQESEHTACLQAALDFFNPNENWLTRQFTAQEKPCGICALIPLTRQFTAEYAALFRVILPTLAAYGMPLPLGGTSNHFRVSALAAVGHWDAFNVTEDADLGVRLARHGFKTGILHSTTYEEANTRFGNWMKQRRRWLKGFLQTWLVHNRNPLLLLRETGLGGFCVVQAMTLGIFASALLHPLLLVTTLWNFCPVNLSAMTSSFAGRAISGFSLAILLAGYVSAIMASSRGLKKIGILGWPWLLASIPFYWLLTSAAAWLALWDFLVAPFHWHKTEHGLSRVIRKKGRVQP
jgi:glycosyltransferase XagB